MAFPVLSETAKYFSRARTREEGEARERSAVHVPRILVFR